MVFYYERSTNVIGIQNAHPILQEAFPFKAKADRYYQIMAIPFYRFVGLQLEGAEVFVDPEPDAKGVFQLDLRITREVFGGRRRLNKLRHEAKDRAQ